MGEGLWCAQILALRRDYNGGRNGVKPYNWAGMKKISCPMEYGRSALSSLYSGLYVVCRSAV